MIRVAVELDIRADVTQTVAHNTHKTQLLMSTELVATGQCHALIIARLRAE
jgi:hypothetical protein